MAARDTSYGGGAGGAGGGRRRRGGRRKKKLNPLPQAQSGSKTTLREISPPRPYRGPGGKRGHAKRDLARAGDIIVSTEQQRRLNSDTITDEEKRALLMEISMRNGASEAAARAGARGEGKILGPQIVTNPSRRRPPDVGEHYASGFGGNDATRLCMLDMIMRSHDKDRRTFLSQYADEKRATEE